MKINLKIEGDHEDNRFLMFLVMLERADLLANQGIDSIL